MTSFGRHVMGSSTGLPIMVTADGVPKWVAGGITIDWSTVTAEVTARTLTDGTVVAAGAKALEFGTILAEIAVAEVQVLTLSATGGTFTVTGNGNTTAAIAYNASAATLQTALRGLGGAYALVVVTGSAGGPYTITYPVGSGDVAALATTATNLTGGSGTAVVTTGTAGSSAGYYGPYSSAATDGRQALVRGRCAILNETVTELGPIGLNTHATAHPGVFEGGRVWRARLKVGGVNPTSIGGNQPSVSDFETAFPLVSYADL